MSQRILLVQPASNIMKSRKEGKPALQPLGLAYIAGTLLANGHKDVSILDVLTEGYYNETEFMTDYIRYGLSPDDIKQRIKDFNPTIVGISCMMSLRKYQALEIADLAKEVNKDIITVIGGNPVAASPLEFASYPTIDYCCIGEGEQVFLDIVNAINDKKELHSIDGIVYKLANDQYNWNNVVKREKIIDKIPFPAHHLLQLDKHLEIWNKEGYHYYPAKKYTSMIFARGCPNLCEHCPHELLFPGYRFRSAQNVFEELKLVHDTLGVEEIQFHEYNGIVNWKVVEEFCNTMISTGYNKKVQWGWPIGIWLKALTKDRLTLMREAGMTYVDLAIESSNQKTLDTLMKGKDVDLNHTQDVIKWSRDLGYYINCFFMLGLEGQTKQDIEETITYASSLDVDSIAFFIAQPLPGTPFYRHCDDKDLFIDGFEDWHLRYGKANINVPGVTPQELEAYRHIARQKFLDYWKAHGRVPYDGKRGDNFLMRKGC